MTPIIISLVGLALTILGLVWKLSAHTTKVDLYVAELRKERKLVRRIPMIDFRLEAVEKHLELSVPEFHDGIDDREHDAE